MMLLYGSPCSGRGDFNGYLYTIVLWDLILLELLAQCLFPIHPALDHALWCRLVVLDADISILSHERVGLDKHLSRLLLQQHNIPDLGAPVLEPDVRHLKEILGSFFHVGCGLVDVQFLEEITDSCSLG